MATFSDTVKCPQCKFPQAHHETDCKMMTDEITCTECGYTEIMNLKTNKVKKHKGYGSQTISGFGATSHWTNLHKSDFPLIEKWAIHEFATNKSIQSIRITKWIEKIKKPIVILRLYRAKGIDKIAKHVQTTSLASDIIFTKRERKLQKHLRNVLLKNYNKKEK